MKMNLIMVQLQNYKGKLYERTITKPTEINVQKSLTLRGEILSKGPNT